MQLHSQATPRHHLVRQEPLLTPLPQPLRQRQPQAQRLQLPQHGPRHDAFDAGTRPISHSIVVIKSTKPISYKRRKREKNTPHRAEEEGVAEEEERGEEEEEETITTRDTTIITRATTLTTRAWALRLSHRHQPAARIRWWSATVLMVDRIPLRLQALALASIRRRRRRRDDRWFTTMTPA